MPSHYLIIIWPFHSLQDLFSLTRNWNWAPSSEIQSHNHWTVREFSIWAAAVAKSLQSCPTLCNPMDCSLPGSSVHGESPGKNTGVGCHVLPQRIFWTRDRTCISYVSCIGRQVLYHQCQLESSSIWAVLLKLNLNIFRGDKCSLVCQKLHHSLRCCFRFMDLDGWSGSWGSLLGE